MCSHPPHVCCEHTPASVRRWSVGLLAGFALLVVLMLALPGEPGPERTGEMVVPVIGEKP